MELVQNSKEWLEWRKQGLGASDANIIMGKSEFKTVKQLWEDKLGLTVEDPNASTFIQDRGHRLEELARPLFELERGLYDFPSKTAVHSDCEWLRASLDGYCEELNEAWENKFVGQDVYEYVLGLNEISPSFEYMRNAPKKNVFYKYYNQIQQQCLVSGVTGIWLYVIADDKELKEQKARFPYKTAKVFVQVDIDYIKETLLPKLQDFWQSVIDKIEPKLGPDDVLIQKDMNLKKLITKYGKAKAKKEKFDKEEKELKKMIYKACNHNRVNCYGHSITETMSEGTKKPDYQKYCEDNKIDMTDYQKESKGKKTQRITLAVLKPKDTPETE